MFNKNEIGRATNLLTSRCDVVPEKYAMYNGAFLFLAYSKNVKNKDEILNPYYLVDLKTDSAGSFSPAFDFDGFFKAVEMMKTFKQEG